MVHFPPRTESFAIGKHKDIQWLKHSVRGGNGTIKNNFSQMANSLSARAKTVGFEIISHKNHQIYPKVSRNAPFVKSYAKQKQGKV